MVVVLAWLGHSKQLPCPVQICSIPMDRPNMNSFDIQQSSYNYFEQNCLGNYWNAKDTEKDWENLVDSKSWPDKFQYN